MRRGLHVTLMAVCCLLLAAVLALLSPSETVQETAQPSATQTASYFMLYERDLSLLKTITVQPKDEKAYTVISDMAFDASGQLLGVYNSLLQPFLVADQELFTLSTTVWQMLLLTAQHIPATASYPALDREACGLNDPDAILTLDWLDGTQTVLRIGHLTSDGLSCYVSLNDEDTVYLVPYDFHETMCRPLEEQHTLPGVLSETASTAIQIALTGTAQGQIIATKGQSSASVMSWHTDSPIVHDGSTDRIEAFIEGVCAIAAESYVATVSTVEALETYGLAEPRRLIVAFQDGVIRDIHIGNDAGEGRVYVRMDRTGDVYTVSRTQLAFADQAGLDTLLDRYVALIPSANVSGVTLSDSDGIFATLTVDYADEEDNQGQMWYANDEAISRSDYAARYSSIIALSFDQTAPEDATPGELLADITFTLRDGTQKCVRYETHNAYYALATTDGGGCFLVRLSQVEAMLSTLKGENPS